MLTCFHLMKTQVMFFFDLNHLSCVFASDYVYLKSCFLKIECTYYACNGIQIYTDVQKLRMKLKNQHISGAKRQNKIKDQSGLTRYGSVCTDMQLEVITAQS